MTTRYIYEYDEVILELDATGSQTARNVRGNRIISRTTGATVYFHHNGQGDVTSLVNASGTIVAEYYYDAWGNHLRAESQHENPYRYRGYIFDEDSGLYYLKARFYDPELARFMQEDTYRGKQHDPLSLNLYTYCHNNPIKYYDPTGHNAVMAAGMAAGSAAAAAAVAAGRAMGLSGSALGAFMSGQAAGISNAANSAAGAVRDGGGVVISGNNISHVKQGENFTLSSEFRGDVATFGSVNITNNGIIGTLTTGVKSTTTINNHGVIDSIFTGNESKNTFNNHGAIRELTLGIGNSSNVSGNAASAVWFDLRSEVGKLPSTSFTRNTVLQIEVVTIAGVWFLFEIGSTGVRTNSSNRVEVRSDVFAEKFMPASGERVFIGSHSVVGVGNHAGIIMMIDSSSGHWNDNENDIFNANAALFGGAIRFATIGAGSKGGVLFAEYNRDGDVGIVDKSHNSRHRMEFITSEVGVIDTLIERADHFRANHNSGFGSFNYWATPRAGSNSFNSNSFAHGLLISAGFSDVSPPSVFGGFAGWSGGQNLHDHSRGGTKGVFGNLNR